MTSQLNTKIAEYAEGDTQLAAVLLDVAKQLHRIRKDAAHENNRSMADVFEFFGFSTGQFAYYVRALREGKDPSQLKRFDELSEYAGKYYRHLLPACSGESDSDTFEHAFAEWLKIGYITAPPIHDDGFLDDVADAIGLYR